MPESKCWLMKSEPNMFSIYDLKACPDKTAHWDGVRNYQARNFMRDEMTPGDRVLFYHSRIDPGVAGTARVVKKAYPDHTSWDPKSKYFDARSSKNKPLWFMVDVKLDQIFSTPLALGDLREEKALKDMLLLKKGMRLSIQPVTNAEFKHILAMAKKKS